MSDRVCIKAYLLGVGASNNSTEVRRFYIPQNGSPSYAVLREKLASLFPQLQDQELIITWKDREGDEVRINSDDELSDGLIETKQVMGSEIFKISVRSDRPFTPGSSGQTSTRKTDGDVHPNVECDGCNTQVKGFRYKCLQCVDYDLCANCEASGTHSHHNMIRLVHPIVYGHPWRQFMRRCHRWFPVYENGAWSTPEQKREKRREKNKRTCDQATGESHRSSHTEDSSSEREKSPQAEKKAKQQQQFHAGNPFHWSGGSNCKEQTPQPRDFGLPLNQLSDVVNGLWTGLSGRYSTAPFPMPPPPPPPPMNFDVHNDLFNNLQEHVKSLVNPLGFGVDVHVDIDHNGKRTCFHEKKTTNSNGSCQEKKDDEKKMETEDKPSDTQETQTDKAETQTDKAEAQTGACETVVKGVAAMQIDEAVEDAGKTLEGESIKDFVVLQPSDAAKISEISMEKGDWQIYPQIPSELQQETTPSKESSPEVVQAQEVSPEAIAKEANAAKAPTAPQQQQISHPDPKVAKSLAQMLAMGFTNEGGWLTQLLEIKEGDISLALDVLNPVFPKNSK